jgi:PhnB protein
MTATPYIMFNGNCEEALNFYASALGGKINNLMRFEGSPVEPMAAKGEKRKILHSSFEAKGVTFMASDAGQGGPQLNKNGMVHLCLNFEDPREQKKVFNALAAGGEVGMPLQETFWGAKYGMLTDKFGVNWMLNCEMKK